MISSPPLLLHGRIFLALWINIRPRHQRLVFFSFSAKKITSTCQLGISCAASWSPGVGRPSSDVRSVRISGRLDSRRVDGRGPARRQIAPRAAVSARAWLWLGASHAPARRICSAIFLFFSFSFCTPHSGNAAAVHRSRRNSGVSVTVSA